MRWLMFETGGIYIFIVPDIKAVTIWQPALSSDMLERHECRGFQNSPWQQKHFNMIITYFLEK